MTGDELIEKARQLIDDEVLTRTGRSVGDLASGHVARALADEGLLADPGLVRPMVLLRADDCDCTPSYADCQHGPEPVDALDLALWLHAEAKFFGEGWHNQWMSTRETVHKLQARRDRVEALCVEWEANPAADWTAGDAAEHVRAALQVDEPAEPQLVFVVIADYGTNGASVLRVYDTHPSETTLKALPTQPSDDAPDSPSAVPGYRGFIVAPAEVEHDQSGAGS
jgi:hypothetical protein